MKTKKRQLGMTLTEQVVVISAVALLMFIGLPTARTLFDQMHTPAGVQATISSAMATARAIAAREQRYAGIRFQHAYDMSNPLKSPLTMPQYIIFIVYEEPRNMGNDATCFRAVKGMEPIELPKHIGVMDMFVGGNNAISDNRLDTDQKLIDATTFSIIFSPAGKVIIRDTQTRNKDGYPKTHASDSDDDIFNKEELVQNGTAMFLQDDYPAYKLVQEPSRRSFIIYDRNKLKSVSENRRWTDYLKDIEPVYINPHTGTIIYR
ncbi:MAG: hypothetical protein WDA68_03965 [Phycisphaerae bacterium]